MNMIMRALYCANMYVTSSLVYLALLCVIISNVRTQPQKYSGLGDYRPRPSGPSVGLEGLHIISVRGIDNSVDDSKSDKLSPITESSVSHNIQTGASKIHVGDIKINETKSQEPQGDEDFPKLPKFNSAALLRGFYVFAGLGMMVVMYIVVRTIRLRRKRTTVRKYGILASREDLEMEPLEGEDDDEDTTLFDVSNPRT